MLTSQGPPVTHLDAAWVAANFAEAEAAPFSSSDLAELSRHLTPQVVEWGEVLFHEGEHPSGVWLLQTGAIELIYGTGEHRALIRIINPGEAVGDIQLLRGVASPFKARAAEPSECLFIARKDFDELLDSSTSVSRRWMAKLALQVAKNHNRIVALLTSARFGTGWRSSCCTSVSTAFSGTRRGRWQQCSVSTGHRSTRFSASSSP